MSDTANVPSEVVSNLGQTGQQVVKEVANLPGGLLGTALSQVAGTQKTPAELEQAKAEQAQKDAATVASVQAQVAQRIEMNRQARKQMDTVRKQEQESAPKLGPPGSSLQSAPDLAHKSLERRSDKRHG